MVIIFPQWQISGAAGFFRCFGQDARSAGEMGRRQGSPHTYNFVLWHLRVSCIVRMLEAGHGARPADRFSPRVSAAIFQSVVAGARVGRLRTRRFAGCPHVVFNRD